MSWVRLQTTAKPMASQVSLALALTKGGIGRIVIGIPSALAGQLGFDASDTAAIHLGEGEDEGRLWIAPSPDGIRITRLKHCCVLRFAPMAGVELKANKAGADYRRHPDGGLVVDLPAWLLPGTRPAVDRPGSIEINGTVLFCGAKTLPLTKCEATIMRLFIDSWGKCVRRQQFVDALYSLDPNGGAGDKIIDVWISKLRAKINEKGIPIHIVNHRGVGWEARRPVA